MRHGYFGKKLSRTKNERRQLFRNQIRDLIIHDSIKTTVTKAKAVQPLVEKLITKAKVGSDQKKREVFSVLTERTTTKKLFLMAQDRFKERNSGFTRIVRIGVRRGDNTEEAVLTFVDPPIVRESNDKKSATKKVTKKSEKTDKKDIKKRIIKKSKEKEEKKVAKKTTTKKVASKKSKKKE
ncbi:50S ribosomal protein L17 [Patescibacteria group bacterium]